MKNIIKILPFIFLWNFAFGQSVGISVSTGYEFERINRLMVTESLLDSTYSTTPGSRFEGAFKGQVGLNFYRPDYSSRELIFGYSSSRNPLSTPIEIVRDSAGVLSFSSEALGTGLQRNANLGYNIFRPFATRNDRVNVFWGYGLNSFFSYSDIVDIQSPQFFRTRRRLTGISAKFLSKVVYQTKKRHFLLEGVFGINSIQFAIDDSQIFDPRLTERHRLPFQSNSAKGYNRENT